MEVSEVGLGDDAQGVLEHGVVFGGEAGDDVGAEDHFGPKAAQSAHHVERLGAGVAALHALQDHVVARLQAEMQMRHQAAVGCYGIIESRVCLNGVDR